MGQLERCSGAIDPNTRFACSTDDDCGAGFLCAGTPLECVPAAAHDAGTDGGPGRVDAGVDGGVDAGADAGVDVDRDGSPEGVDCDDTNPAVHPGAAEMCANGLDDDCDLAIDCQQASCNGLVCAGGGTCTGATCTGLTEVLCNDGLDNDGDGKIDCADSECPAGTACSDFNGCTTGDRCVADGGCEKTADALCTTPPNACFTPAGVCLPDAGATCAYAPRAGSCNDGLACTLNDTCSAGSCGGTPRVCASPPNVCFSGLGSCVEPGGACTWVPNRGLCNDGQNCTLNDTCDGDGGCAGTPVTCTPPTQCHVASGACDTGGGCLFNARTGLSCDAGFFGAGTCSVGFACLPAAAPLFPYPPSNFLESQLAPTDGGVHFDVACNTTLDTTVPSLSGNGCATLPPFTIVTPAGGEPTVVFTVDSMSTAGNKALTITGSRPVIFAVLGNVLINGPIRVQNAAGTSSACGLGGTGTNGPGAGVGIGGGGGGGFGTMGAAGGAPGGDGAGLGGAANGNATLIPLRGGCNGGAASADGGVSGGALQISATGTIALNDLLIAPGKGGTVSTVLNASNGGGGGGSGGALLLEGAIVQLSVSARLTANGGGGAEGGALVAQAGSPGSETSGAAAPGGNGGAVGGNGGAGGSLLSPLPTAGALGSTSDVGGGGGGGAVGRIRINTSSSCAIALGAVVSPAATSNGLCP